MDVATWTTISRLLDEALDLPPHAQVAWLEHLGPEYDTVRARLEALLTDASSMDRVAFLATLPKFGADDVDQGLAAAPTRDGALVGPYRLRRIISSGGQASVWLAERADGLLARPVAVKLPHGLAFRPGLAERMAREREILAGLAHPNIATLYDAGFSAEGEPYLALEYVEGVPIDRHAAERQLDTAARVRLFQQVIAAVAFAHGRLVIHRDLKPSNILVTTDGEVRLLDFGIAKLLAADGVDSTLTRESGRAMTLAYASPEQVAQESLGVATDVYSLGVVLYELVTGARPYVLARDSAAALEEAVLSQEPRRASDVAGGTARRALAGDLDTILAKALKKDPVGRYATAGAFGDDLARWLDGRPVRAQPDSRAYRARKFVARHRVGVAAAAASIAAVLGGTGVALWQAQVARAERDAALVQQRRAEASSGFLDSLLQQVGGERSPSATALLERGTTQLDHAQGVDASVLPFLRYEVSKHYLRFNQTDRELALLGQVAADARRANDFDLLAAAECSSASAVVAQDLGKATAHLTEGEAALARASTASLVTRSDCVRARARVLAFSGQVDEGIRLIERRLPEFPPPRASLWSRHGILRIELHALYARAGRYPEALRLAEEVLDDMRSKGMRGTLNEFSQMANVAAALARVGEARSALALYRELVAWLDRGAFTVEPLGLLTSAGDAELRAGDVATALTLAQRGNEASTRAGNRRAEAGADLLAARALLALQRPDEATRRLDAAEVFLRQNAKGNVRVLVQVSLVRAEILAATGAVAPAMALVEQTLAQLGYPERRGEVNLDRALRLLAGFRLQAGDAATAHEAATAALDLSTRSARSARRSADVGEAALLRVRALLAMGRTSETSAAAALAIEALTHGLGADHALTREAAALRAGPTVARP